MGFFEIVDSIWEFLGNIAPRQWGSTITLLCFGTLAVTFLAILLKPLIIFLKLVGIAAEDLVKTIGKVIVAIIVVGILGTAIWAWKNPSDAVSQLTTQAPLLEQPIPIENTPVAPDQQISPIENTPVAPDQQVQSNGVCWTYQLQNFSGTRWRAWEMIAKDKVGNVIDWTQFKTDVINYNQILVKDKYEFFDDKTYLLPEKCP